MKKLVLTAITGNYDELLTPNKRADGWDYTCVTDDPDLESDFWKIIHVDEEENAIRTSRMIKSMALDMFPEYDYILWVDGNQQIVGDIEAFFQKYKDFELVGTFHPERDCTYDEAKAVIRLRKDSPAPVNRQVKRLHVANFPENYGLTEMGVSLRKNTEKIKDFERKWWEEIKNYSHRDQLSFDFVRWMTGINVKRIDVHEREMYFKRTTRHIANHNEGIDVVYPLGTGSRWANNELRYSIRSVIKHFTNLRNIVVIGEKPRWLTQCIHIALGDLESKDVNIRHKLKAACNDNRISETFIYAADDKFMTEDLSLDDLDGWSYGKIVENESATGWNKINSQTAQALKAKKKPVQDYNKAHAFQPIEKKSFLRVIDQYNDPELLAANLYLNNTTKFKGRNCRKFHVKIHEPLSQAEIIKALDKAKSFNINEEGLNDAMKETLMVLYPYTSYCEIYGHKDDPYSDYQAWLENKNFWEGVKLIEKHTRNRNLLRFFLKKGESPKTQKKLEMNLKHISRKWKK